MSVTESQVVDRLDEVLDPCSCMTEQPVSIVDLGLVEEIDIDGSSVFVELLPTTPMCMYMTQIIDEAGVEIRKLDGVETVDVTQNVEDMWRPERMDAELQQAKKEFESQLQEAPDAT